MKLVIVESPTKAKTIGQFIGKDYIVESSFGHVRDLPKSKLGIDVENNFMPQYIIPTKSRKTVTNLKKLAKKCDTVILATDEDREGEAIAWHLTEALGLRNSKSETLNPKQPNIERIVFHEITKGAIKKALDNPRSIFDHLVDAQQARRILDRLVGYKLSPFLWKKIARGLSAGRVQSVTVRLIVEREKEINTFKPQEYWTIEANLKTAAGNEVAANLLKIDGREVEKFDITNAEDAQRIILALSGAEFGVINVQNRSTEKHPMPPFTTSTLQQTAARRFGYSSKQTMFLAQHLYEQGLITYMRTDSVNLSQESLSTAKSWLERELGAPYAAAAPRTFSNKSRLAQEAHEAIRPTDATKTPEAIISESPKEKKLYTMIWQRFIASQMPAAEFDATTIDLESQGNDNRTYGWRATGTVMKFDGYAKIWPQKFSDRELPEVKAGEKINLVAIQPIQHFTEPPPRFSEATIIKTLEEFGIGRPSTYAPTISTIQARNYVEKRQGKFYPTEIGTLVTQVLMEHFPKIVDVDFTAKMEEQLDQIADGKEKWQSVLSEFYVPFAKTLEEKYASVTKAVADEKTDEVCEKCGKPMIVRFGRFGRFLACSGFPECKNAKPFGKKETPKSTGIACEKCKVGELIEKRVNRGRARGKHFWGCNRYPECDFATWTDPTSPKKEASQPNSEEEK